MLILDGLFYQKNQVAGPILSGICDTSVKWWWLFKNHPFNGRYGLHLDFETKQPFEAALHDLVNFRPYSKESDHIFQ